MSVPIHQPVIHDLGIIAEHDVACAVCGENKAVYQWNTMVFEPCWSCQGRGWQISKKSRRWWSRR